MQNRAKFTIFFLFSTCHRLSFFVTIISTIKLLKLQSRQLWSCIYINRIGMYLSNFRINFRHTFRDFKILNFFWNLADLKSFSLCTESMQLLFCHQIFYFFISPFMDNHKLLNIQDPWHGLCTCTDNIENTFRFAVHYPYTTCTCTGSVCVWQCMCMAVYLENCIH